MQRYRESRFGHGDYYYDSAMPPHDQFDTNTAQETDSFCSALETLHDVDESEYPNQYEETSFTQYDRLNKLSEQQQTLNRFGRPSEQRDLYNSQQTAQSAAPFYHPSCSSSREYAQEGLSSLQTRLNSFAAPRSRRAIASPTIEDSFVLTVEDNHLPSSPTPNHALNAQPLSLAPITVPVRLEFTAPTNYVSMISTRETNGQDTLEQYIDLYVLLADSSESLRVAARRDKDNGLQQLPRTYLREWQARRDIQVAGLK